MATQWTRRELDLKGLIGDLSLESRRSGFGVCGLRVLGLGVEGFGGFRVLGSGV